MESRQELNKALSELNKLTGVSLDVHADSPEELRQALSQIRCLVSAYKDKYNKNHFFQSLMSERLPSFDVYERATRLHIEPEVTRVLFLVETKSSPDEAAFEVLKNMFPPQSKTYLVPMGEKSIAILRPVKNAECLDDFHQIAHTIVDTLNTEALSFAQISYSGQIQTLNQLPAIFRESSLALRIGKLFYSGQTVFPYDQLGIGRLIYQLPATLCEQFLHEIYGADIPNGFDEETTATINKFFQNNLNIAETARQLHMHRNTLIYRLEQIEKRTGLDIRKFEDAMTFKIATMVVTYLQTERNS